MPLELAFKHFFSCATGEEPEIFDLHSFKKKFKRRLLSALENVRTNPFYLCYAALVSVDCLHNFSEFFFLEVCIKN